MLKRFCFLYIVTAAQKATSQEAMAMCACIMQNLK